MQLEGKNSVYEALKAHKQLEKISTVKNATDNMSLTILRLAREQKVKVQFVDKKVLDRQSKTKMHQNFIAYTQEYNFATLEEILGISKQKNKAPFIVILDGIEDPHNFGSIIRVCECCGVDGIIIPKHNSVSVTETVARTSAGAINHIKIAKVTNLNNAIEELKKNNVWVYALELGGENLYSQNLTGAIAIVVGSEGFGVSKLVKQNCDGILTLPMKGQVNSLNASVATGVAVFEVLRQKLETEDI